MALATRNGRNISNAHRPLHILLHLKRDAVPNRLHEKESFAAFVGEGFCASSSHFVGFDGHHQSVKRHEMSEQDLGNGVGGINEALEVKYWK